MTGISPSQHCHRCGGKLVPPELLPTGPLGNQPQPNPADYVCVECGQKYRWFENPPRLMAVPM